MCCRFERYAEVVELVGMWEEATGMQSREKHTVLDILNTSYVSYTLKQAVLFSALHYCCVVSAAVFNQQSANKVLTLVVTLLIWFILYSGDIWVVYLGLVCEGESSLERDDDHNYGLSPHHFALFPHNYGLFHHKFGLFPFNYGLFPRITACSSVI